MESYILDIVPFLNIRDKLNMLLLSKKVYAIINDNNREIIEAFYKLYPSKESTLYESIISIIRNGSVEHIKPLVYYCTLYLPIRWMNILKRMLWTDILFSVALQPIARIIFDRVIDELPLHNGHLHWAHTPLLKGFVFKYDLFDKLRRLYALDGDGYGYDEYQCMEEYIRFSPNVKDIIKYNRTKSRIYNVITISLGWGRTDVLDAYLREYRSIVIDHITTISYNVGYKWPSSIDWVRKNIPYINMISTISVSDISNRIDPLYFDMNSIREYIEQQFLFTEYKNNKHIHPEIYDMIMLQSEDDEYRKEVLRHCVDNNVPEMMEKYIYYEDDIDPNAEDQEDRIARILEWHNYKGSILKV